MSQIEMFFDKYGPVMTLAQLAGVLDRSSEGLRISLRGSDPFAVLVRDARVKLGRRVYFSVPKIAKILGLSDGPKGSE
jgi:hypothetical protein